MDSGHRSIAAAAVPLGLCVVLGATACQESQRIPPDSAMAQQSCESDDATIGRCLLVDTGAPCAGVPDEQREFVALDAGDPVAIVLGPQGSSMFVLAARTTGIFPGDPDDPASPDNPEVNMSLWRGTGEQVALYRGRPFFAADAADPTQSTALGLFVIMEGAHELIAEQLEVEAHITDRDGEERCGTARFTVSDAAAP